MSRCAPLLVIAIAGAMVVSASACSLVSGWSDLQGGQKGDGGRAGDAGSSTPLDGGSSGDARVDGSTGVTNVACAATRCPAGVGCCVDADNASQCGAQAACPNPTTFLACSSAATCPTTAPVCCLQMPGTASVTVATCNAGCGDTAYELCNPAEATPCSFGKKCKGTFTDLTWLMSCQ